jgi:GTP-binding protein EngB required for normal cell division
MVEMMASVKGVVFFASRNQLEREMADSFGKNFTLVLRIPPLDEKTGKMLEAMRNYLEGCTELMPAGRDDEDTDEEEDHQLEEDGIPWHMIQRKRKQVVDKIRELASHLERNKHLEDLIQFCITSGEPGKGGCRYSIYEGDHLVQDNLIHLPSPPTDLRVQLETSGGGKVSQKSPSFSIEWNCKDPGYPCQFLVEFRPKGSCDESWKKTTLPGENQTTFSFQSGSVMEIRVAAETCIGRSEFSNVVHTESVHADESDEFRSISGSTSLRSGDWSNNLMQDANPFFSSSPRRQEQQRRKSSSTPRIAQLFTEECSKQNQLIKQGSPNVYLLNAKENSTVADFRWFDVGRTGLTPPPMDHHDHKVIILMGAAGSGKSTLINGMVNYILGVEWKDPFRFQCVRQDDLRVHHSQPGSVTAYTLRHQDGMAVPYSITIVETPGYGNTKGARRDKEVTRKIQRFLTQEKIRVDQIHAVCFVAASNDIRSTSMHPYILDSVLSLFGRDVKDNIRLLVTFADMAHPPVVEACASAKFPVTSAGGIAYSKFDNSVLYASNEQQDEDDFSFDELFWQMGQENYQKFFAVLEKMNGRDLASTREVIQRRLLLDQSLKDIERGLEVYLVNVENVQMFRRKIKEYGDKMEANRNFILETKEVRRVKVDCDRGFVAYNCRHCQRTCEDPVRSINFDYFRKSKKQCSHIFCPCPAFEHEYQQFQWRQGSEKVSTILPEMKAEYESNGNDKLTTEKLLMGCLHELKMTKAKLFCLLARVGSSCLLLEATALRSNTLSLADYLSLMRSRVAEELAPGYLTRLEILKELQQSLARRASESNALELHADSPINRNRRKASCQFGEWQSVETFANSFAIDECWS